MSKVLAEIYQKYRDEAYRVAFTYLGDSNMAEDIVQEAYVRLKHKNLDDIDPKGRRFYFLKVIINLCRDELRRKGTLSQPTPVNLEVFSQLEQSDSEQEQPDTLIQKREFIKAVRTAADQLPEKHRDAFILYVVEEYSAADTARIMESSPTMIATWVYRAKKQMQSLLNGWQDWYPE